MWNSTLAFYMPQENEDNVIEYSADDLSDPHIVKQVFDYCQILEGHITYSGWLFLVKHYGYEGLCEIDKQSGWFDSSSLDEFVRDVELEIRMVKASESDTCIHSEDD